MTTRKMNADKRRGQSKSQADLCNHQQSKQHNNANRNVINAVVDGVEHVERFRVINKLRGCNVRMKHKHIVTIILMD